VLRNLEITGSESAVALARKNFAKHKKEPKKGLKRMLISGIDKEDWEREQKGIENALPEYKKYKTWDLGEVLSSVEMLDGL
jgi:hypothetical protein